MIKKVYIQPTLNVVKFQQQHQLLAGSTKTNGLGGGEEVMHDEENPSADPSDGW